MASVFLNHIRLYSYLYHRIAEKRLNQISVDEDGSIQSLFSMMEEVVVEDSMSDKTNADNKNNP